MQNKLRRPRTCLPPRSENRKFVDASTAQNAKPPLEIDASQNVTIEESRDEAHLVLRPWRLGGLAANNPTERRVLVTEPRDDVGLGGYPSETDCIGNQYGFPSGIVHRYWPWPTCATVAG